MSTSAATNGPADDKALASSGRQEPAFDKAVAADQVPALAALLTSDNAGTAVVLQVTTNLVIASATYLTASFALVLGRDVPAVVLLLLPIPVLGLQMMQMVLGASAVWRSRSAEVIEGRLLDVIGANPEMRERLGSALSSRVTDPNYIAQSGKWRRVRMTTALLPYNIFYFAGLSYTVFMVIQGVHEMDGTWPRLGAAAVSSVVYLGVWLVLLQSARINFSDDWSAVLPRRESTPDDHPSVAPRSDPAPSS